MNEPRRYFTDQFEHTVDAVNRIVIPSAWRTGESERFFVFRTELERLVVLTASEMEKMIQTVLSTSNASDKEKRDQVGALSSNAVAVVCDKQGRITMESRLMKHVNLKDKAVLVGRGLRFEIWNPRLWQQHKDKPELVAVRTTMMERYID